MSAADWTTVFTPTQNAILERLNRVYANGEGRLDEPLPPGERGDTLADFIVNEVVSVTEGMEDNYEAWDRARRALMAAETELVAVEAALLGLSGATPAPQIFDVVDKAYHMGEGRITEDISLQERGDTLAHFLRLEIEDVCKGAATPALQAYYAVKSAAGQITACICELSRDRHVPRP